MEKQLIGRDAGLPHSPAVVWRDLVFVSGQVGFLSGTREFEPGIEAQTRQALQNVLDLLAASGCEADGVLQMTVHMTDMIGEFAAMNAVFREFFPTAHPAAPRSASPTWAGPA